MPIFTKQVCNKQYTTAMELEEHLSSYDHHHKKVRMLHVADSPAGLASGHFAAARGAARAWVVAC